ncbi:MAG TPA: VWA domain-containing protein [Pyrinomonadaceae bacterium]
MSPRQQDEETVRVGTSEVVVDVVVRDKKDRHVKDLTAADFEIHEDGVRQQVQSFRLVTRGMTTALPAAAGRDDRPPVRETAPGPGAPAAGVVAIVFDRLSPDARARAGKAALSYVGAGPGDNDFIGVFAIDQSLRALQPFTADRQLVRRAVERAAGASPSSYTSNTEEVRRLSERQEALARETGAATGTAERDAAGIAEEALTQMTARTLETYERLEREQQGYATTNGLLAVVNAMGRLRGRKALIFLSEGVAIPTAVQDYFRAVIGNANRANVSIYAVDAAGLRVESTTAETQRELQAIGARRQRQAASGLEDRSGQPMSRVLERNEDVLRLNPESGLGQLADQTGGLLISQTNDIASKLRQVDDDLHTHYVLSYVPANRNYDGRFRQIAVKLNRAGYDVRARKGYYAINATDASPVLAYEAPALAALGGARAPSAFPVYADGFGFPEAGRPDLVAVVAEIPHGGIDFSHDAEKKIYRSDFSVVALIRDEARQVVRKLSRQYLSVVPGDRIEAAKRGLTLFYRETDLPAGRYTLDVAVHDAVAGKTGVSSGSLEVSGGGEKLRMGSLAILKRAEKLSPEEQKQNNPFHYGEVLVYPNLGEPIRKATAGQLAFFLTAYTARPSSSPPKLMLEIKQRGRTLSRAQIDLPAPDAAGRIQFANALPIDKLQPGEYELSATATDGATSVTRVKRFVIQ